ncbi:hypothetical protein SNOG_00279 [Parastagonospora nodorum SN15]|uniref:Uncharacterized protein n=1 Tax=Phaeosphaeria nodorum (strain SN15 / ATCC MYA-4574 / FGSC 10173) TaxID=321614 RepID=Q0V6T5_PHANO|nr:hypothetical protein SNOG_00279 [Parastagonospora nodorum SN15]EAT91774.2 hypothetical protein SNOG_00279 [Parastagonospora nodorum SN15]
MAKANGSMSSFLMSRKLVASPSHRRPEKLYREQTPNTSPTLSWRSREAQIIRPQHGYGSRKKIYRGRKSRCAWAAALSSPHQAWT